MSSVMDSEVVVPSCFKVLATALTHLLTLDNMEPESKTWQSAIKYSLEFLKCTFTVPDSFKFNKEQNLGLGIQLLPLTYLVEYGLTSDDIDINCATIKLIGICFSTHS